MSKNTTGFSIGQMIDIIAKDYSEWYHRGITTGKWVQEGIIFLRGVAGTGKTEGILQLGEMLAQGKVDNVPELPYARKPVQLFFNAAMDPESIAGTPAPTTMKVKKINPAFDSSKPESKNNPKFIEETMRALSMHYREELMRALQHKPGTILFCDEMGRDAPHMRAAQLKLLSPEKTLSGLDMNHFYIICAGNPSDDQHRVDDIMGDAAIASRLIPFEIKPSHQEWADWMYEQSVKRNNPTFKEIANFILDYPLKLVGRDDENDPTSPFRNPRAWTIAASRLHVHGGGTDKTPAKMNNAVATAMVKGIVGGQSAMELSNYLNQNRTLTLSMVLKGKFNVDKTTGRISSAPMPSVIRELQHHLSVEDLTNDQAEHVADFLKSISADLSQTIQRNSKKIKPKNHAFLARKKVFTDTIQRVKRLQQA